MSFVKLYHQWKDNDFKNVFNETTNKDILNILEKERIKPEEFLQLLSPAASYMLEPIAAKAHQLTVRNFGRIIKLYAPLYVSNYCDNHCLYCGFSSKNIIKRKKLNLNELKMEAEVLVKKGIKHILLLAGGSRCNNPPEYLKKCIEVLNSYFSSVSIEIYALKTDEYKEMISAGVEGLTIYQEVYNQKVYKKMHIAGTKKKYFFRLNAPERACHIGMRFVNIGALLGLSDWRREAFFTGLHAYYLQKKYLASSIGLSIPRIKPHAGNFSPDSPVDDKNLVQIILAYRNFLPRAGISLSTREKAELRDNLISLGVTSISAESSTAVGGYASGKEAKQFENADNRTVKEIEKVIRGKGYQPVFKDWQKTGV